MTGPVRSGTGPMCHDCHKQNVPGHWSKDEVPAWLCDVCWGKRPIEHDGTVAIPPGPKPGLKKSPWRP